MSLLRQCFTATMAFAGLILSGCDKQAVETLPPIPSEQLQVLGVPAPLKSVHFRDREGEGLLVLNRIDGQASDPEGEQTVDKVVLVATLYGRENDKGAFAQRWRTEQETTCPGLDLDADFFNDVSDVGDVDGNGIADITLASHAYCGGSIEPHDIVVELREGKSVYNITGRSQITPAGEAPMGGERHDSASLAQAPAAVRAHLDAVWQQVYKRPWSELNSAAADSDDDDEAQ